VDESLSNPFAADQHQIVQNYGRFPVSFNVVPGVDEPLIRIIPDVTDALVPVEVMVEVVIDVTGRSQTVVIDDRGVD
jgi:hypothetical protein